MTLLKFIPLEERIVLDAAAVAAVHAPSIDPHYAAAPVIYVNANATGSIHDGTSWAHAYTNLQDALIKAQSTPGYDQIWMAKGTYTPGLTPGSTFNLPEGVAIEGGFKGVGSVRNTSLYTTTLSGVISGGNSDTILTANGVNFLLDGVTVSGANDSLSNGGNGQGGGLEISNSLTTSVTDVINNVTFANNSADVRGGGIYAEGNLTLDVLKSAFLSNTSVRGGAIRVTGINALNVFSSDFNGNHGLIGGGVYGFGDLSDTVAGSSFENNLADINGGALRFAHSSDLNVTLNTISRNTGQAVVSTDGTNESFTYNSFTYNTGAPSTTPRGGGLVSEFATGIVTISHNLFDHNTSLYEGLDNLGFGGAAGVGFSTGTVMVSDNIFSNNSSQSAGGLISAQNTNIVITRNLFLNNSAIGGINPDSGNGGAIEVGVPADFIDDTPDVNVVISQNIFIHNSAAGSGGAIATINEIAVTIDSNVMTGNTATNGGAIADLGTTATLTITNNVLAANCASSGTDIWLDGQEGSVNGQTTPAQIVTALTHSNAALMANEIVIA